MRSRLLRCPGGRLLHALALLAWHAALEIQAGVVGNELGLEYGLSGVVGQLLELYFDRP